MASARCPVCEDIINIGIAVKLYQPVTCPTCLANLKVVAMTPLELELNQRVASTYSSRPGGNGRSAAKKPGKGTNKKNGLPGELEGEDEDEALYDDYILEKRLRYKSDYDRKRSTSR
jgi:hypothetical protein